MAVIEQLLARGTRVVVAGIDLDRDFSATHTQVLRSGEPFLEHLGGSEALPDDGTFSNEAPCRSCFVRPTPP